MKQSCLTIKMTYKRVAGILLLVLLYAFTEAQPKGKGTAFPYTLKERNMSFIIPRGYIELDSTISFNCGNGHLTNAMFYAMARKDNSVIIAISSIAASNAEGAAIIRRFSADYASDRNYIVSIKSVADTIHNKLIFYDKTFPEKPLMQ
jgi:hypothetical protein